ncbi:hypothetical protein DY000_02045858 [Brassica cretica]|uniref:Uncharacterized protein n=1 Tax=Brassica cretica TaxID=69181 RepID=A0ABQ7F7S3_BRACR|nr:hypothetical protein DY000_02045858 [Brassica cretica]
MRRIHQRKPFVDPISDAPTISETIRGAVLIMVFISTLIKLSFRRSLSVINVLSLSSACVQLRPNPRPDATVREKKQARDSSRQRDPIGAVPRPFVLSPGGEGSLSLASPALGVSVRWIDFGSRLWLVCGSGFVVHGFVQSDELSIGSMKLSEVKTKHGSEEMVSMEALR